MPYLSCNGLVLRYRVTGTGPPLLLIRGLVRCGDFWLDFEDALRPHFTVIVHDNRGTGGSSKPLPPYTTSRMADDSAALLAGLGFDHVDVFGLSLGGMIAQRLALRHPAAVRRLALGATSAGGRRHGRRPSLASLARLASVPFSSVEAANRMSAGLVLSKGYLRAHPEIEGRWLALLKRWPVPRHAFLGQLGAAMSHRAGADLARLRHPTLVVSGDEDALIAPRNSELLARLIPGARLEWVRGAGHDFPTERPEEVAGLLRGFFYG